MDLREKLERRNLGHVSNQDCKSFRPVAGSAIQATLRVVENAFADVRKCLLLGWHVLWIAPVKFLSCGCPQELLPEFVRRLPKGTLTLLCFVLPFEGYERAGTSTCGKLDSLSLTVMLPSLYSTASQTQNVAAAANPESLSSHGGKSIHI